MTRIDETEFWRWAYADFLSNALRGVLAEFIVARALGCAHRARREWDAVDLETDDGLRIEVKSAGYVQTWEQKRPSPIRFDISRKRGWDASTNVSSTAPTRSAHVYVFAVFAATEKPADPLELDLWFFLVCPTRELEARFDSQKSVSLSSLEAKGLRRLLFDELRDAVLASHVTV